MAETQYAVIKSRDGTYAVEISGGELETILATDGFSTEDEAREWIATQRRKAGHNARWSELPDDK